MKRFLLLAATSIAGMAAYGAIAQTRTAEDAEALQRSLQEKAVRIPARSEEATAARSLAAPAGVARMVQRRPDMTALREDLRVSREADTQRRRESLSSVAAPSSRTLSGARDLAVGPPPPPPPGIRPVAADRLPNVQPEEIERVLIPVLIPAHSDVRDKIKVYGMPNVYTATAEIDANASLSITGTCNRVVGGDPEIAAFRKRLAAGPRRRSGTGAAYHISRNDFGVDLSFSKFGCGYVMTVECSSPANDVRCAEDDYITGLADSMILANPELADGE